MLISPARQLLFEGRDEMLRRVVTALVFAIACGSMPAWGQAVIAVPDMGSADAGVGSRAIANVAANDTVNGSAATL